MKITVIVPVYNSEAYLPACLDSILSQTHSDLEVILVDDGSQDRSPAICDAYADKDTRIHVIHQENSGVSAARNAGLDSATGDWIGFVDADDTIESDMYETLLNLALENDADIAHCGYRKVHFDGTYKDVLGTGIHLTQETLEASECVLAGKYFTGSLCTKLCSRKLFRDIRFDKELKINEDILLNIQVFQLANKLVFWDVPKYHYYERSQSATRKTNRIKIKRDCVAASEKILEILKETSVEQTSAQRLYYALIDLYRVYLFEDAHGSKAERNQIRIRLKEISQLCVEIPSRNKWNYRFMRYFPQLYVWVYNLYDKIRVPNIDL